MLSRLAKDSIATVDPRCTVSEAAREMTMLSVGALVVIDPESSAPIGIVTDRDLVKMIGEGLDAKVATVGCFAGGAPLQTIAIGTPRDQVLAQMRRHGVRRLPIVDDEGRLAGIVTLDDLLLKLGSELGEIAGLLEAEFENEHPVPSAHDRSL